ncbi:MAG: T9SS type A sorting domain-containing protein [Bacteroidales bacterium]|nr:T9SS type A sorting domain-containing protein [Bacteroidales bacterium]
MTNVLGFGGADEHITANTSATNVVIAKNAKLTIDDDATLNVEGICLSASHDAAQLVIAEGGQLVHHNEGTVATFQKRITAYNDPQGNDGYYLIANPTDNETVANLVNEDDYDLYTFDGAADLEWINMKSSPVVANDGIGYLYANSSNVTLGFAGEIIPAGSTDINLNYANKEFGGFNLLGNPYACNVYLDKPAYLLDGGEYLSIAANTAIAPCEGFFVEATAANQSVTISTTAPEAPTSALSLTVSQNRGNVIDRAIVSFDGSSNLHKFMTNPAHTNISLAKGGETFAAVSTEAEGEIPVSFKAEKNGSYTITVNTENVNAHYIHLIDNKTGMDVDLLATPSYTFNASTSDYAYRFKLVFSMTGVEENESNANSYAYISNGNLVIDHIEGEATMQIVDMLGRVVSTEIVSGSYNKALNLKAGLYIINLNGMTQKIVVK